MKLNRLVFLFRYFPTKHPRNYFSMFFGLLGSFFGFAIWINDFLGFGSDNMAQMAKLESTMFLFIPASLAVIAALCHKTDLKCLAFLLSLPVLSVYGTFSLAYVPFFCYFISVGLMYKKSLTKKEKEELEEMIIGQVQMIGKETAAQMKEFENHLKLPNELNAFTFKKIYETNLKAAKEIKQNYDHFIESKGLAYANTYRLGIFYLLTRTNGLWDLKQTIGDDTTYTFKGSLKTGEYIGNHHFGYIGRAVGFSCNVLRIAAGMYQVYSRTSNWKYIFSYFDDPKDSKAISDGCTDYDRGDFF
ncbi:hypothetical protein DCC39_07220 [Pueribacillus theae]|uniref:Bacterial toxin 44 domain-containing protein n=1 Tax=Pueribacillus theae TaxID=2171751 RepID=A0A2U1K4U1_9BACI|nr:polymorphic toxin type 44 domain-containing protein [Pueribacillus theae]PWA12214.1 hypothetical protein DCC39_07220 [Pueribacillus theae]